MLDQRVGLERMGKQDAGVEVGRRGQAGDRYHRLGLRGDKEPFGLSDLILHHAEVQSLHPIGSIGWVAEIKQADKVVLEDLAVGWADQHAPVDQPRLHAEDLHNRRQVRTVA